MRQIKAQSGRTPPALSRKRSGPSPLLAFIPRPLAAGRRSALMAIKYSELELAINTMVTEFHKAADDAPTMNTTQFQTFVSKQMPLIAKTVETEEGLGQLLQQMGIKNGENISFTDFWKLINKQAVEAFNNTDKQQDVKCSCLLQ